MRARIGILLILSTLPAPVVAQWSVAPEIGLAAFSGSARDSGGLHVGPTRSTTVAFRVGWEGRRVGAGLRLLYASSGIGASNGDFTVIQEHQVQLFEIATVATLRVARVGSASVVRLEAGPVADVWAPAEAGNRTRFGALLAAAWFFPITQRLAASIRVEGTLSTSLFDAADLPPGAERRSTWRRGVAFAVRRRL
jgi:hypothetical protein